MPRTADEAVNTILLNCIEEVFLIKSFQATEGWQTISTTCTNFGQYAGYRYKLRDDNSINLLFDRNGIIAGIQALVSNNKTQIKFDFNL